MRLEGKIRHFTSVNLFSADQFLSLLDRTHFFSSFLKNKQQAPPILQNKLITNLFFENSTRTRLSFEIAAKRLGGDVVNFAPSSSSIAKGESLIDTVKTLEALGVDIAIIRHSDDNFITSLANDCSFHLVNAGSGKKHHPSQTLLDLYTIKEEFGDLKGLTVTICGDILSSRVATSNIEAFTALGMNINLAGPQDFLPSNLPLNCKVKDIDSALKESDVAMFLRIQHERHSVNQISTDDYHQSFGLTKERLKLLNNNAIIMHPGPFNRGIELAPEAVHHPKSRIFKQKENGVYARMAIFEWIINGN